MEFRTKIAAVYFAIVSGLFLSCKDSNQNGDTIGQRFLDSLVETQIGQMTYCISIPAGFSIKENEGPDFSVFYFTDRDTTAVNSFSGGMYFGNHPSIFPPASDSCKVETMYSNILGSNADWTVYECDGTFVVQTIVDSGSDEGWDGEIHAFGRGESKEDLDRLLAIYSTLYIMN